MKQQNKQKYKSKAKHVIKCTKRFWAMNFTVWFVKCVSLFCACSFACAMFRCQFTIRFLIKTSQMSWFLMHHTQIRESFAECFFSFLNCKFIAMEIAFAFYDFEFLNLVHTQCHTYTDHKSNFCARIHSKHLNSSDCEKEFKKKQNRMNLWMPNCRWH